MANRTEDIWAKAERLEKERDDAHAQIKQVEAVVIEMEEEIDRLMEEHNEEPMDTLQGFVNKLNAATDNDGDA